MCRMIALILGVWIFAAAPSFAQPPAPPSVSGQLTFPDGQGPQPGASLLPSPNVVVPATRIIEDDTYRFWIRAEYLTWWVKNTPLPISLVTGDPNHPNQELLDSSRDLGTFSGFRVGLGVWFDQANNIGMETNAFALERRTRRFFASSDDTGNPTLAFPFTSQTPGSVGDFIMPITSPGQYAGSVLISSSLQLWGAEANGMFTLGRSSGFEWTALAGFRYLDLYEKLNISTFTADLQANSNTLLYQSDQFNTRNQFYGGQIGTRLNWQNNAFAFDITGKVALGATHQTVDINGFSTQSGPTGPNGSFPGGFFTQPSNMGHFTANQFAVIPSVEMKFHIFLTPHVRAFIGYDFMYWNQVVRPGSQVDRNINLTQSPIYGTGTLSGPAYPAPLFNRTDFWAQGMTFGFEFRF
jgi:hypothetical protein